MKSLRNGANHGLLVLAKAVWRTTGGLWPWNRCKKSASAGEWEYIGYLPKGKTRKFGLNSQHYERKFVQRSN